ncbi:MAG: four helix bundle protein, partial [Candidatus Roizmanbacteria bacterium]|nr:four helix bundle protein [Candidatus Roizmanbacteria bacterium]
MDIVKKPIISFRDLEVYRNSYQYSIIIMTKIINKLPQSERFDLKDQLSRSCKAIPRLIAEGYAKRHQRFGFQKYLDDALAESNETIVSLEQSKDIYGHLMDKNLCDELIKKYDILSKQIYTLRIAWKN